MSGNNVNTTSKVIKANNGTEPYELGTFITNDQSQNESMKNVATLNNKSINGNVDPVLTEIQNLQKTLDHIGQRVESNENDGVKGRDLDKQLVAALKDLKNYSSFFEQATFQMETKLVKTSFSIAKKIIGIELGENSAKIAEESIKGMMVKIKTSSKVTIHLNPKDYITLKDTLSFDNFVNLQEDSNVAAGGVVIASDLGNFDGSVESTLDKTDDPEIFTGNVRIEWPDPENENWFVFATSKLTLKMENIEFIEYNVERYSAEPKSILIRVWPLDFDKYNEEFF